MKTFSFARTACLTLASVALVGQTLSPLSSVLDGGVVPQAQAQSSLTPFACNDDIYLMTANGTSTIQTVDPQTAEFTSIGTGAYNHNGTALNPVDGYIYGVTGGRIIRIGQGVEEELLDENALPFAASYSGAFMADGTYIVNGGTSPLYHVDVTQDPPVITKTVDNGGFNIADIARNPIDGFWYAYDGTHGLIRINVHTGDFSTVGGKSDLISLAGSAFFHSDGTLYLYGSRPDGRRQDTLFTADTTTGEVTLVKTGQEVGGSDGASCVKGKDADPDADPDEPPVDDDGEDVEENDPNEGGEGAPTLPIVSVCRYPDPNDETAGSCDRVYPSESTDTGKAYYTCVEGGTLQSVCHSRWLQDNDFQICNADAQCGSEAEPVELPELNYDGCFEHIPTDDDTGEAFMYCPHKENGTGVAIDMDGLGDMKNYYQTNDQKTIVVKVCRERSNASGSPLEVKTGKVCSYVKYGKYVVEQDVEDGIKGSITESLGYVNTIGICEPSNNPTFDMHLVTKTQACRFVAPIPQTENIDVYERCMRQGKGKSACSNVWGMSFSKQLCTSNADCL